MAAADKHSGFLVPCDANREVSPGIAAPYGRLIRDAGGRVTEAVINDIAFISYLARTMIPDGSLFEVAAVRHTGCGTGFLAGAAFRSALAARTGLDEAVLAAEAVIDPAATVRADVGRLLSSAQVPPQISVSGHVYDVQTGLVTTITGVRRRGTRRSSP